MLAVRVMIASARVYVMAATMRGSVPTRIMSALIWVVGVDRMPADGRVVTSFRGPDSRPRSQRLAFGARRAGAHYQTFTV